MTTTNSLLDVFIAECREDVRQMQESLLRLDQSPDDRVIVDTICRTAHNIKGSASMLGLVDMAALALMPKNALDEVRCGERRIDSNLVAFLLAVCERLRAELDAVARGDSRPVPGVGFLNALVE